MPFLSLIFCYLLFVIGLPYTAQTAIPLGTTHPSALLILYKHNSKSC